MHSLPEFSLEVNTVIVDDQLSQIYTGLLLYVWIHQVRIPMFNNYQMHPVALRPGLESTLW